jgi:hypothetical protein
LVAADGTGYYTVQEAINAGPEKRILSLRAN